MYNNLMGSNTNQCNLILMLEEFIFMTSMSTIPLYLTTAHASNSSTWIIIFSANMN